MSIKWNNLYRLNCSAVDSYANVGFYLIVAPEETMKEVLCLFSYICSIYENKVSVSFEWFEVKTVNGIAKFKTSLWLYYMSSSFIELENKTLTICCAYVFFTKPNMRKHPSPTSSYLTRFFFFFPKFVARLHINRPKMESKIFILIGGLLFYMSLL